MINYKLIQLKRESLGLSQTVVAERVSALSGEKFSQQAYRKVEKGITNKSGFLPYICQVLGIRFSEIEQNMSESLDSEYAELLDRVNKLPKEVRLTIVQDILKYLK